MSANVIPAGDHVVRRMLSVVAVGGMLHVVWFSFLQAAFRPCCCNTICVAGNCPGFLVLFVLSVSVATEESMTLVPSQVP